MNISIANFSIHHDGLKFVCALVVLSLLFMTFSTTLGWIFVFLSLFCAFFFRNPKRAIVSEENLIVSPADGIVSAICLEAPPSEIEIGEEQRYRVSIFLSVFNVHVNRVPFSGLVRNIIYNPGSFLNASLDKASIFNEKNTIVISSKSDPTQVIAISQIAGMLARRIICDIHEGEEVKKGYPFGIIRFGSRVDIWLPAGIVPNVVKGQTMVGGETIIADISSEKTELSISTMV